MRDMALRGVLPVLPTLFTEQGKIDPDATLKVLSFVISAGAHGVVFPGLASEYDQLTREERLTLIAVVGTAVGNRVPFVVGASAESLEDVVAFARAGASAGAAATMVLTPKTAGNDLETMAQLYDKVGAASGLPVMLQNAPIPMGIGLPLEDVARLAQRVENIRYVKEEAQPSGHRISRLTELADGALDAVFGGAGARYLIDELNRGAIGTMPACEITDVHVAMLARFERGDEEGARMLFERSLPLLSMQAVFRWRLTKEVLRRRGIIDCAYTRAPGPSLDRQDHRELDALLDRLADLLATNPLIRAAELAE